MFPTRIPQDSGAEERSVAAVCHPAKHNSSFFSLFFLKDIHVVCGGRVINMKPSDEVQKPIRLMAAACRNMGIGKDGRLPWNLP